MAVAITRPGADITGVAASGNVASYTSVNIGTAAADRIVVVCVGTELTSSVPTAATIDYGTGALAMTAAEAATQGAVNSHIFYLPAPTGTSATVNVTFGATNPTGAQNHIAVYRVVGALVTPTDTGQVADTDADPISSGALVVPTNGGGIAVCSDAANATTRTWSGFTLDLDVDSTAFRFSTGTTTTGGTPTITVSGGNNEDGAISWVIFRPPPDQTAFRFYEDGTEAGSTAIAAQDTDISRNVGADTASRFVHVRFRIQNTTAAAGAATDDWKIYKSRNGAAYVAVDSQVAGWFGFGNGTLADDAATTNRLGAGTGSFVAGKTSVDGLAQDLALTASNYTEFVYEIESIGNQRVNGDTYDFRVYLSEGGGAYAPLSYTVTPRITLATAQYDQKFFRFYEEGTESGSTAIAAQDTNISRDPVTGATFHLRFGLQNSTANATGNNSTLLLYYSKNSGAWNVISDASSNVRGILSAGLVHADDTTERLTGGTGTFQAGDQVETPTNFSATANILASGHTEHVFSLQLQSGDLTGGDTIDFRLVGADASVTDSPNAFTYTLTPRVTITGATSLIFDPIAFFRPFIVR